MRRPLTRGDGAGQVEVRLLAGKKRKAPTGDATAVAFIVGLHDTCRGIEQGVVGMRPGGRRVLTIPAALNTAPIGEGLAGAVPPGEGPLEVELHLLRAK